MIKIIFTVIKKIIFAILMLYSLNLLTSLMDVIIPINIVSIVIASLLGIPGLLTLIALYFLI